MDSLGRPNAGRNRRRPLRWRAPWGAIASSARASIELRTRLTCRHLTPSNRYGPRWAGRAAWVTHGDGRTPGERAQGIHVAHDAHHAQHLAAKQVGQQEQLPAGQEFLMAPRRLLARRGQVEKLLTLHGVLGLFGELSIFLRFAAKVVDVLHAMVSHLSGARVATQPTRRSMTRKHESCTSGLMQI